MGVHEPSEAARTDVRGGMARDRFGSDYSENMSEATTCSCTSNSVDKCSLRGCGTFQEPFFLHPPGSRPRDGIYVNPMTAYIGEPRKAKDAESFYLHSPHDLVYTRITRLFGDGERPRTAERRDETLTVKVDVHANEAALERPPTGNGFAHRPEIGRDAPEHAYEQICPRQEDGAPLPAPAAATALHKKPPDNVSDTSRSRKTDRRYSRSSSASESSNVSSEIQCFSSSTSTPSLSRNSSNERTAKSPLKANTELPHERREFSAGRVESEKDVKSSGTSVSLAKPPPPPPPPPPPEKDELVVLVVPAGGRSAAEAPPREERKDATGESGQQGKDGRGENDNASSGNRARFLLTFGLLSSIAKGEEEEEEEGSRKEEKNAASSGGPPPPPLSPLARVRGNQAAGGAADCETSRTPQPLATISIQDLTSIQLRRTSTKMNAAKTFSAPPPRSVSMTNVSEPFFVQKTDLIAELKRTKDIPGIKKLKVERAQVEKTQEQNLMSEINKAFSVSNFVDQIPEKDSSGNAIPIWKRQMLARKAAERAKKELEEQIARENEERRQKAIPPWKRQLLAKKDTEEKRTTQAPIVAACQPSKAEASLVQKGEAPGAGAPANVAPTAGTPALGQASGQGGGRREEGPSPGEEKRNDAAEERAEARIIPWRAQLRKTNSKLNILE
ncbi:hypothetical protein KM043_001611 [Ampulex compressa]|nr:hypothetical protein KM043_001611 [Ampulex compressa]